MKNKKILMLLEHAFPPDIRVEKEAKALLEAGFDLSLVCAEGRNVDNWNGMKIYRVPVRKDIFSKLKRQIFIIHTDFYKYLDKLFKNKYFDIIHVHDLRLVPTALKIKEKYGCKVIADLHENYPAGVREWNKSISGIKKSVLNVFNNYNKWFKVEKEVSSKVDKIIAVVDEMKERMIRQHNISENKIVVVSNLEDIDFVKKSKIDNEILDKYKNKFVVLYIGGFGAHRGIDTAIKGMKYIKEKDILLLIVGRGSKTIENYFRWLIKENHLSSKVEMLGWQPFEKVFTFQKLASICIVPHNSNEHTDNTIPHKLYQYMMVGKPVVVSSCPPLARVVKEAKSGFVFQAGNPKDFADKILKIYNDKTLQKKFIQNALNYTFKQNHTWQEESKKLVNLYREILKSD
jgi:glycosyltransferase involved in cell wall biosynthesis